VAKKLAPAGDEKPAKPESEPPGRAKKPAPAAAAPTVAPDLIKKLVPLP
jgi:hypothetical protein